MRDGALRRRRPFAFDDHRDACFTPILTFSYPPTILYQAKFGAKSNTVKARRAVVVAAVTEPEAIVADKPKKDKSEFKKKFVKKNVTVQDADIVIGASFPGKVVRRAVSLWRAEVATHANSDVTQSRLPAHHAYRTRPEARFSSSHVFLEKKTSRGTAGLRVLVFT